MIPFNILLIVQIFNYIKTYYIPPGHTNLTLSNFTFGSCFGGFLATEKQWIFKMIKQMKPQLWIWGGDAAYLDSFSINYFRRSAKLNFTYAEYMFNKTKNDIHYKSFSEQVPTIGVWDDHDYGINDGNKFYKDKEIIKRLFLNFIDEPQNSIRRVEGRGIYTSYSFGSGHKTFKVILLDVRFDKNSMVYNQNPDILGDEQWIWLENELKSNETFTFLVSGTQVLPFNRLVTEAWYGDSRTKLFELIKKTRKSGVILLSGDIHCAQILATPCISSDIGYKLYEITSSGLTHHSEEFLQPLLDYILPNDYMVLPTISDYNYALFNFDWGENNLESKVIIKIIDLENTLRLEIKLKSKDLIYGKFINSDSDECKVKISKRFKSLREYLFYYKNDVSQVAVLLFYFVLLLAFFFVVWIFIKILKYFFVVLNRISMKTYTLAKEFEKKKKKIN